VPGAESPAVAPATLGKRHEVLGLLTLSLSALSALALASYDSRGGRDWAGPAGSVVAESLVAVLGTASIFVPLALLVQSVRFFRRMVQPVRPLRVLGTALIVGTIATALHLALGERPLLGHLAAGGLVGVSVGEALRAVLGTAGAHLVVLTALLVALVVRTRLSVVAFAREAGRAGAKTGSIAKEGVVSVARAWQRARSEDESASEVGDALRIITPEQRVESALAEVLETQRDAFESFEDEESALDHGACGSKNAGLGTIEREAAESSEARASWQVEVTGDAVASPSALLPSERALTPLVTPREPACSASKRPARRGKASEAADEPVSADARPSDARASLPPIVVAPSMQGLVELDAVSSARADAARWMDMPEPEGTPPSSFARARATPESPAELAADRASEGCGDRAQAPNVESERALPSAIEAARVDGPEAKETSRHGARRRARRSARPVLVEGAAVTEPARAATDALAAAPREAEPTTRKPIAARSAPGEQATPPATQRTSSRPPPLTKSASTRPWAVESPTPEDPTPLPIVSHEEEIAAALETPPVPSQPAPRGGHAAPVDVEFPSASLLTPAPREGITVDEAALRAQADRLVKTLKDYQIEGEIAEIHPGPVVTTFEFVPTAGTKLARIAARSDDIAMSLAVNKVRIVAPIPGKGRVGFEIPNASRKTVYFRELVETEAFNKLGGALPVALGKDVVGAPFFSDLATMPHLIVAGATGQGKSVGLNVMLCSMLYKRAPDDVRLLMIDPKMVELAVYDGIPHMLLPVVTDMKKAALALRWVVDEMERRYTLFAQTGSRNIVTFNERVSKAIKDHTPLKGLSGPVRTKHTGTTTDVSQSPDAAPDAAPSEPKRLPYIVVVVDEFADLMMVAGKEVEAAVARLAQKARAAGIHVILATQRPSVDVITGMIKANFPSRVAFKVTSKVDSRTILDQQGAENLLGRGDMLILPPGSSDLRRVHCAFVSEDEVQAITDHWRKQGTPTYDEDILRPREEDEENAGEEPEIKVPAEKYEKAVAMVLSSRRCSVSWIQRQLAIGYNVAARIVERMEREGIVSAPRGPGKDREVLG
jgi:S-DNA-T family DNA segregation ATPase FtsK/SpoIIIE